MDDCVTRIWRQGFGQWWAELWVPDEHPPPFKLTISNDRPPRIEGMQRSGLLLSATRRKAVSNAALMKTRHAAGLTPDGRDPSEIYVEVIQ